MKTIAEILETKKADMRELEKFLYDNPEIEMEEFKAKEKFIELLEKEGFEIEKEIEGLPTAFVAHKSNGEGPSIGICSEYDALPGIGHACGHNLIGAMGYGAAVTLTFLQPVQKVADFSAALSELSGGQMSAEEVEQRFMPGARE